MEARSANSRATRNLYELNLRVRYLLADPVNVNLFRAEMISDQIKLLGALAKLVDHSNVEGRATIQRRIDFRRQQLEKNHLEEMKQMMAADLAKQVGATDEHDRFYKLYSKYVHPSAYLVNSGQDFFELCDRHSRKMLLLNAQLYARDTLELISQRVGISPNSLAEGESFVSAPKGRGGRDH